MKSECNFTSKWRCRKMFHMMSMRCSTYIKLVVPGCACVLCKYQLRQNPESTKCKQHNPHKARTHLSVFLFFFFVSSGQEQFCLMDKTKRVQRKNEVWVFIQEKNGCVWLNQVMRNEINVQIEDSQRPSSTNQTLIRLPSCWPSFILECCQSHRLYYFNLFLTVSIKVPKVSSLAFMNLYSGHVGQDYCPIFYSAGHL